MCDEERLKEIITWSPWSALENFAHFYSFFSFSSFSSSLSFFKASSLFFSFPSFLLFPQISYPIAIFPVRVFSCMSLVLLFSFSFVPDDLQRKRDFLSCSAAFRYAPLCSAEISLSFRWASAILRSTKPQTPSRRGGESKNERKRVYIYT